MTTTSTPDATALRRACAANPDDATARLVYADALAEAGDERAAIEQRIVAQPDDDTHRLNLAEWWGANGDRERGEFVRVQCELESRPPGWGLCGGVSLHAPECAYNSLKRDACNAHGHYGDRLRTSERELLTANEARWRAAGKCEACKGTGDFYTKETFATRIPKGCRACSGTGDAGGLMQRRVYDDADDNGDYSKWRHPVRFVRGVIERVDCTLAECGSVEQVRCHGCDGYVPSACIACRGTGTVPRWVPSPWARAVLRGHVTVRELWVTDLMPGNVFEILTGADIALVLAASPNADIAHTARTDCARALATLTRVAVESE